MGWLTLRGRTWYWFTYAGGRRVKVSTRESDRAAAERAVARLSLPQLANARAAVERLRRGRGIGELTGAEVMALRAPIVYAWFRGATALYVGKGETGMSRPLSPQHHRLGFLLPDDRLKLWACETAAEACDLEVELIRTLKPSLNRETPRKGRGPVRP